MRQSGPSVTRETQQNGTQSSRKRKLLERENSQSRDGSDSHYSRNEGVSRPQKHNVRRVGHNAGGFDAQGGALDFAALFNLSHLPPPPPGPLPFGLTDPSAFFAMAAASGFAMPGMPPMSLDPSPNSSGHLGPKPKCNNYHNKGFCGLGTLCPYEHGNEIIIPADQIPEYDPENAFLALPPGGRAKKAANSLRALRGLSHDSKGGRRRASFSQPGPSLDRTNTTLVVEQIPGENFSEEEIRAYFSQFGAIDHIRMHTSNRLAILKFENRDGADQAYNSPKAVFDNRFVKVYWHRSTAEGGLTGGDAEPSEEREDPAEIAKRQAEAQKAFEERRRKTEEADARSEEIDRQLKEKNEEMTLIRRQLAELSGDSPDEGVFSQTLATLQAEAEDLFAQRDPSEPSGRGRGGYGGGYRGRGKAAFPPRGRAYRGGYRGRSAANAFPARSSVKRLDNRPRRLAVAPVEVDSPKDEALRQYLIVSLLSDPGIMIRSKLTPYRTCLTARASSGIQKMRTSLSSRSMNDTRRRWFVVFLSPSRAELTVVVPR